MELPRPFGAVLCSRSALSRSSTWPPSTCVHCERDSNVATMVEHLGVQACLVHLDSPSARSCAIVDDARSFNPQC
eukprot:6654406-Prymnesium_polylepis.2